MCKMLTGEKGEEDRLRAVSFAAGTAAFMACIERAVMVSVFVHWRVWAFLALNLLLLAILFTSKSQIPLSQTQCKNGDDHAEVKRSKKRIRHYSQQPVSTIAAEEVAPPPPAAAAEEAVKCLEGDEIEGKLEDYDQLSEEELKQRVEDFIAMFRQHLICDANGTKVMGCASVLTSRASVVTSRVY